ncbi:MAG TPA: hypothetical protein VED40_22485 [Azospirillaceae bacterium]|nr:hypothetical protein [Azospirillaceae bacterium]
MPFLRLRIYTAMERNAAITATEEAVVGCGGWLVDHSLFSDAMATLNIALPADQSGALGHALAAAGLKPEAPPPETMGAADSEIMGQITLTFTAGTGDLRREVPAFD